jgi:hypothetical protein
MNESENPNETAGVFPLALAAGVAGVFGVARAFPWAKVPGNGG